MRDGGPRLRPAVSSDPKPQLKGTLVKRTLIILAAAAARPRSPPVRLGIVFVARGRRSGTVSTGSSIAGPHPRRRQGPHAVPVREGHPRPQRLLRDLRDLLATAAHTRQADRWRGVRAIAARHHSPGGRDDAGDLRRPSALPLSAGHEAGPDERGRTLTTSAQAGTCSHRAATKIEADEAGENTGSTQPNPPLLGR